MEENRAMTEQQTEVDPLLILEVATAIRNADGDHTMSASDLAEVTIRAMRKNAAWRVKDASKTNYAETKKTRLSSDQTIDAVFNTFKIES